MYWYELDVVAVYGPVCMYLRFYADVCLQNRRIDAIDAIRGPQLDLHICWPHYLDLWSAACRDELEATGMRPESPGPIEFRWRHCFEGRLGSGSHHAFAESDYEPPVDPPAHLESGAVATLRDLVLVRKSSGSDGNGVPALAQASMKRKLREPASPGTPKRARGRMQSWRGRGGKQTRSPKPTPSPRAGRGRRRVASPHVRRTLEADVELQAIVVEHGAKQRRAALGLDYQQRVVTEDSATTSSSEDHMFTQGTRSLDEHGIAVDVNSSRKRHRSRLPPLDTGAASSGFTDTPTLSAASGPTPSLAPSVTPDQTAAPLSLDGLHTSASPALTTYSPHGPSGSLVSSSLSGIQSFTDSRASTPATPALMMPSGLFSTMLLRHNSADGASSAVRVDSTSARTSQSEPRHHIAAAIAMGPHAERGISVGSAYESETVSTISPAPSLLDESEPMRVDSAMPTVVNSA